MVTSIHAIQGAATLKIATADGHSYPATIVRADPTHGVVLLQAVGAQDLTPLTFASVTPRVGDLAIAVAHIPFSPVTLSTGTVSSIGHHRAALGHRHAAARRAHRRRDPRSAPGRRPRCSTATATSSAWWSTRASAAPGVVALSMTAAANLVVAATGGSGSDAGRRRSASSRR